MGIRSSLLVALSVLALQGCASFAAASGDWYSTPRAADPELVEPQVDLPRELASRRARLAADLGGPCVIWLAAGTSGHGVFFQDDDFYYLTGVEIADIAMAIRVDEDGAVADEVLYLPPHDPHYERWEGKRLAPGEEAVAATGFARTAARPADDAGWTAALEELGTSPVHALGPLGFDAPDGMEVQLDGELRRALDRQRLVKSEYEIQCLRNAIDITGVALRNALTQIRPGAWEYQAQAAIEETYRRLGSERPGFPSICGSGPNAVTLHYATNRRQMQDGELILMDVGAKYRYYCADITRTVPVNGRFTPRQREVYELVLKAQQAAADAAKPGVTMAELKDVAMAVLDEAGGYGQYFVHGLGHWIGLDVHDVGGRVPIVPGTLFTIEPGVYIDDENLGIRIEDDYLMTEEGAVRLSVDFPTDPDEVEALMASLR